jgi:hypothetical protein
MGKKTELLNYTPAETLKLTLPVDFDISINLDVCSDATQLITPDGASWLLH